MGSNVLKSIILLLTFVSVRSYSLPHSLPSSLPSVLRATSSGQHALRQRARGHAAFAATAVRLRPSSPCFNDLNLNSRNVHSRSLRNLRGGSSTFLPSALTSSLASLTGTPSSTFQTLLVTILTSVAITRRTSAPLSSPKEGEPASSTETSSTETSSAGEASEGKMESFLGVFSVLLH